ncbi:hypothetical protein [Microbispora siamensis]|uniref:Polyprenyl synthetase family protein n=1 Tax=Microbispora siamensis TaxID=564413 RepID=A0ABQ4GNK3_9ACTN|nr:hypothetical protein [Microbispora siamensis]GIH62998.1 hypothetical protein Msi02_38150 [Microbispora siamensis]
MLTLTRETGSVPDETREPFDRHLSDLFDRTRDKLLRREMNRLSFLGPDDREVLRRHLADFVACGGRRLRPAFVYWGHRASGGSPDDLGAAGPAAGRAGR